MTEGAPGRREVEEDPTLDVLGAELWQALDTMSLAVYVLDADGIVRWTNKAAAAITGPRIGESYLRLIAPEHRARGKIHFARTVVGGTSVDFVLTVVDRDAARADLRIHAAPLRQHANVIGAIGIAMRLDEQSGAASTAPAPNRTAPTLTPRQAEVLRLLAEGFDTSEIARRLGVAVETARNHIRAIFRRLDVHSRLEAVIAARRYGLLEDRSHLARPED